MRDKVAIEVWDVWVRLFHWGLVAAVLISLYTTKTNGAPFLFPIEVHAQAGYLVIGLLVFRWLWGVLGSVYARFKTFLYSPVETVAYSQSLLKRQPSAYASHNPLGGWMVLLMLLSLSFQAVSGLFLSDDIFFQAPLYGVFGNEVGGQLRTLHQLNSDLLIILIGLHLAGLILHRLLGETLVTAMLVGTKRFRQQPVDKRNEPFNVATLRIRAIGSLFIAAGVVLWLWF
ncbi:MULTISPECIES: cytochrome b/b6 domain-containing protein [unclassified Halomonas]|uniref:cytochrome b/b6 domain-containing protein n=1 Tax=unclassified Halomonas TaxID=2609666 RepID=UPI0007DA33EF|nr:MULTISPECIES: cytochrome b/b6 domain-containing protein [unclassified Halomonas]MBT2787897.1 cytochrome b/b6 domain-containing protein [Halomonas sp. ISL-106]MBT2795646.1 cytochrome b/b6 domain-containing protein [Halomonas sp. ISL-104]OAL60949.1 cytochrome B [Halomonas sp. ALS9]